MSTDTEQQQQQLPAPPAVDDLPSYASIAAPLMPRSTSARSVASSHHPAFEHPHHALNLPSGYFILRSRAHGRAFDLLSHKTHDGAEVGLHPIKEPVLRTSNDLQISPNNQVLYLDYDGHLNSACASRPIDADLHYGLTIAHTHPIMSIPSRHSHPLPRFRLDGPTSTLHVLFDVDPEYPGPNPSSETWATDYDYIVEAVACKRSQAEPSVWESAATASKDLFAGIGNTLGEGTSGALIQGLGETLGGFGDKLGGLGLFSKSTPASPRPEEGPPPPPKAPWDSNRYPGVRSPVIGSPPPLASTSSYRMSPNPNNPLPSLPADESDDSDSDEAAYRPLRIVRLPRSTWREKFPSEALTRPTGHGSPQLGLTASSPKEVRKWRRRQWEVVPVIVRAKRLENASPSLGSMFTSRASSSRPLPAPSAVESAPASPEVSRSWSASHFASSAGGLVSSISGTLRAPLLSPGGRRGMRQEEEDVSTFFQAPEVGDEDAEAIDIERYTRTSDERERAAAVRRAAVEAVTRRVEPLPPRVSSPSLVAIPSTGPSVLPSDELPTAAEATQPSDEGVSALQSSAETKDDAAASAVVEPVGSESAQGQQGDEGKGQEAVVE